MATVRPTPQPVGPGAQGPTAWSCTAAARQRQAHTAAEPASPSRRSGRSPEPEGLTSRRRRALRSLGGSDHRLPTQATAASAAILPRQRRDVIAARARRQNKPGRPTERTRGGCSSPRMRWASSECLPINFFRAEKGSSQGVGLFAAGNRWA